MGVELGERAGWATARLTVMTVPYYAVSSGVVNVRPTGVVCNGSGLGWVARKGVPLRPEQREVGTGRKYILSLGPGFEVVCLEIIYFTGLVLGRG